MVSDVVESLLQSLQRGFQTGLIFPKFDKK